MAYCSQFSVCRPLFRQPFQSLTINIPSSFSTCVITGDIQSRQADPCWNIPFSFGYTLEHLQFSARILESGRIQTDELIARSVSLDEVPEAFAGLLQPNGHCKIMIKA